MTVLAPAAPRLAVQYGSFALSSANGILLDSEYDLRRGPVAGDFSVTFRVRLAAPTGVVATDDTAFRALVAAVEAALTLPRQTLTATLGAATPLVNWSWSGSPQTALLISPELELLEDNARDFRYRLRVRAQFPGNVPGNVFRRDSLTRAGASLRENRQCEITATWTSSTGTSAYSRYLSSGDAFYDAFLPTNSVDQYGTTGTWVRANEDPAFNDENSVITATRIYWEVFAGRRDSRPAATTTIDGRRAFRLPSTWAATPGFTALQNYTDGIAGYVANVLPTPVSGGEWVLVDETFDYNDQNGELGSSRLYQECVAGLREYSVDVTTDGNGARTLVISGVYYDTTSSGGSTAKANYLAGIASLVAAAVAAESPVISHSESTSIPAFARHDTTGLRYFFRKTVRELVYPENGTNSPTWDDSNVRFELLSVDVTTPYLAQSITNANPVTQLQTVTAKFSCLLDMQNVTNPAAVWAASLRAHVVYALTTKLGTNVGAVVNVVSENVGVDLDRNRLRGELALVVGNAVGGGTLGILELRLMQKINQRPGRIYVERADGTNFSYYPYRRGPRKTLHRSGYCKYIAGTTPPELFAVGDLGDVSGFTGMIDTGISPQDSIDAQNADGTLTLSTLAPNGWILDPEAPEPYSYTDEPVTLGDGSGLKTVTHRQGDDWFFAAALEPGTTIIP